MPFHQLRSLVGTLIDGRGMPPSVDAPDLGFDEAAELEFEAQPTTYAINRPRVSTLDALIATLPPRR